MVLFDEKGNPKLYDSNDLAQIIRLVSEIKYVNGFIEAVSWEENPTVANSKLSKQYAKKVIESLKRYEETVPKEIKKLFDFKGLEKICKGILKK